MRSLYSKQSKGLIGVEISSTSVKLLELSVKKWSVLGGKLRLGSVTRGKRC